MKQKMYSFKKSSRSILWKATLTMMFLCTFALSKAQVTVNPGGTPYVTINAAFAAINAGTHTGAISIEVSANTTEPAAPTVLVASGVGGASYSSIDIYPTSPSVVVSNTSSASRGVLEFNGADNITINGNLNNGTGTSRDLTIQNNTANTNAHTVLWFQSSGTSPQLGCTNITVKNTVLIGNGNVAITRTSTTPYQTLVAFTSTAFPASTSATAVNNSNVTFDNNELLRSLTGFHFGQSTAAAFTNLSVTNNIVGSTNPTDYVIWSAIYLSNCSGALIQGNTIQNLKSIISSSGYAINMTGTVSSSNIIRGNKISGIYNTSTSGWATGGVNLGGGNNHIVDNNVIYDLLGANYSSAATTFAPYGIRITTGTGHKIWYNSINLFGTVTAGTAASTSAGIAVSSTTCTGLQIQNNIISNSQVSTVGGFQAYCIRYASGYNFGTSGNIMNNNYYSVPSANTGTTSFFVGGTYATGITAATLANLKTLTGQDANSLPDGPNALAPFTANDNLTIPLSTVTLIESAGTPIAALGLPNYDFSNVSRPAGTGVAPDMGAYEFEGITPATFITLVSMTPDNTPQCASSQRDISVDVVCANAAITNVDLDYSFNGVPQGTIPMTYFGGDNYQATIPAATPANAVVTWSINAINSIPYTTTYVGATYSDEPLTGASAVATSDLGTVCAGGAANISAVAYVPNQTKIVGAGSGTSATYSNPFYSLYSNAHNQHLVLASELQAAGIGAGDITSLGLNITASGGLPMLDFSLKIAHTSATNMSSFVSPSFTTVYTSASLLPSIGINMMDFTTPFTWDGVSNIVIEICHGNSGSTATMSRTCQTDNLAFTASIHTHKTVSTAGSAQCIDNTTNLASYTIRPRFYFKAFGAVAPTSISWSDGVNVVGTTSPLTVYPLTNTTYTATFSAFGCPVAATPSITVNTTPVISSPSVTNSTQCGIAIPNASVASTAGVNGNGQFTWYDALTGGNIVQTPPLGNTLSVYYTNDFSSSTLTNASISGSASIGSGILTLTPNLTSQLGGIKINASGYQTSMYQVDFTATNGPAGLADGFSYSFGDDVNSGTETLNAENGSGSKLKVCFDTYGGGIGASGVYLIYGPSINNPGQTVGVNSVVAYSSNTSWVNTSNTAFNITVDALGQVSVTIGGTPIFTNVQLPVAFSSADKSTWAHVIKARTGGIAGTFTIDDLTIQTNGPSAGSTTYLNPISTSTTFYVSEMGLNGCPSLRSTVQADVIAPPALTITPTKTICNGSIEEISVTSNLSDYTSYIWSPSTNLYFDPTGLSPYDGVTSTSTIYYKSTTPGAETITCDATNAGPGGCVNVTTTTMQVLPASITVSSSPAALCVSGDITLSFTPTTNLFGSSLQWSSSSNGTTYTDISGANSSTYPVLGLSTSTYYKMTITGTNSITCLTSDVQVVVNNPGLLSTTPGSHCGPGSVVLSAVPQPGYGLNWYTTPTGGIPYTTPYAPVTVTGFNNDIVAGGVGSNSILGTTYPTIGMDGALYTFIDNTFQYSAASALPTCFMPSNLQAPSLLTPSMIYQLQDYGSGATLNNNALSLASATSGAYTSPLPNSGTLTLSTPASYANLVVLYESVVNSSPMTVDAVVTFTDASTQTFAANTCLNWFTTTAPAFSGMGRTTPTGTIQCGATPNMFELNLPISAINQAKQVASVTFSVANTPAGTSQSTVNYFHALAVGGRAPNPTNTFTTPTIAATTTYYVAAASGGGTTQISSNGVPNVTTTTQNGGLQFTLFQDVTLNSIQVYSTAAGTATITLENSAGTVLNTSSAMPIVASTLSVPQTLSLGWAIPAGVGYRIKVANTGNALGYSSGAFPAPMGNGVGTITSGWLNTGTSTLNYFVYNMNTSVGCEGARVPVVATINTAPAITVTPNVTLCDGQSTTLDVTSSNDPNYSYTWNPGGLVGATQVVSPTSNTTYTVEAIDNTSGSYAGCANVGTVTVTVNPNPIFSATATPTSVTCGSTATLEAVSNSTFVSGTGTSVIATTTLGQGLTPYSGYYEGQRTQYLITASELLGQAISPGNITDLSFNVLTKSSGPSAGNASGAYNGYTIKMANTTATDLTAADATGTFTTVYGPTNYNTIAGVNTHTFTTPFVWDGVSNVVVQVCYENDPTTALGVCYSSNDAVSGTTTAVTTVRGTYADNSTNCTSGGTLVTSNIRPNMVLSTSSLGNYTWNPGALVGTPQIVSPATTTIYTVTATGANGCTATNAVTVTVIPCTPILNATFYIQGYYAGSNTMQSVLLNQGVSGALATEADDVTVDLMDATSPYAMAYTFTGKLLTDGTIVCTYPAAALGNSYYVRITHRNSIETWSANPVTMAASTSYDFSTSAAQAYGGNQIDAALDGVYSIYNGDVTQDGTVDIFDFLTWDADNQAFAAGYYATDFNGDGNVDIFDFLIWDPNNQNFIGLITP